uniref:Succinate dehydrogenase assembly factor 4, mitochondrial n=1 Tax=Cyclophora tenuis TaxID=216820 RepID=A0A7S1D661_CYCTE|mmetsp:Transcript_2255/g.3921  ORF Transcript_2255/g.3921 Transcript_2255/m.3921 type:complete len:150 (+) Transcript_2255:46-495(+)
MWTIVIRRCAIVSNPIKPLVVASSRHSCGAQFASLSTTTTTTSQRWKSTAPTMQPEEVVVVSQTRVQSELVSSASSSASFSEEDEKIVKTACGDVDDDDDEMEQEEMFVDPHTSLGTSMREWGGPRRGGRLPEPTRFGDWERKGRCTDF